MKKFTLTQAKALTHQYATQLSLTDFRVELEIVEMDDSYGMCFGDLVGCVATIRLDKKLFKSQDIKQIKETIFHELLELKLLEIRMMLEGFYACPLIDSKIHPIIRTVTNLVKRSNTIVID